MSHEPLNSEAANVHQALSNAVDGGVAAVEDRLCRSGCEWSAEDLARAIAAAVAGGTLVSSGLNGRTNKFFAFLSAVALVDASFGKYGLLSQVLRASGLRTRNEIVTEQIGLRALRGDFTNLPTHLDTENHDEIARLEGEGGIVQPIEERKVSPADAAAEVLTAAGDVNG